MFTRDVPSVVRSVKGIKPSEIEIKIIQEEVDKAGNIDHLDMLSRRLIKVT